MNVGNAEPSRIRAPAAAQNTKKTRSFGFATRGIVTGGILEPSGSCHAPGQPSEPDRANALAFLDQAQTERWLPFSVDLILSPDRSGEMWHPVITGWITRRSNAGIAYTEPANVVGRI